MGLGKASVSNQVLGLFEGLERVSIPWKDHQVLKPSGGISATW